MTNPPPPEVLRQRLLTVLAEANEAMTTADLRRCLSTGFGGDVVHERIYRNLEILQKRGEVARADTVGRHTRWRLSEANKAIRRGLSG